MENRWCIPPIFTQIKVILKILSGCAIGHLILKHQNFIRYIKNKVFLAVQWFPTQKDEIFKDEDDVIPYVRRFTLDGYYHGGYQYLVVQLKKAELDRILSGKYGYFDQLFDCK